MAIPRILTVVLLSLFLVAQQQGASIASDPAKEQAALAAAEAWLALVDQGKYEESWKEAASLFQQNIPYKVWQHADFNYKQSGKVLSRSVESATYCASLPGAPDGEYVVVRYKSRFQNFENWGERIVVMLDKDGKWRVSGYGAGHHDLLPSGCQARSGHK